MSRPEPIAPDAEGLKFIRKASKRNPHRRTLHGVLLAEATTAKREEDRGRAALLYGMFGFRRGLQRLGALALETANRIEADENAWGSKRRYFLSNLLFAVARMDTPASHELLVQMLRNSPSTIIRADVLEQMSFEEDQFDLDLVVSFVSPERDRWEVYSALYALIYRRYVVNRAEDARRRITPFLSDEHPMMRIMAIEVLAWNPENRTLITPLINDPEELVAASAKEALTLIGELEEETQRSSEDSEG